MPRPDDQFDDPYDRPLRRRDPDDEDEDYLDRPRRPRRSAELEPVDLLVPTDVSAWSIISCYAGLIGMCLPIVGLLFAIPALICGIVAMKQRKKARSYGSVTSDIRAILGVIFSTIGILISGTFLLMIASK